MQTHIQCPHCETPIDVKERLGHQLQHDMAMERKRFEAELARERQNYKEHQQALKAKEEAFEKRLEEETSRRLQQARLSLQKSMREELKEEHHASMMELERQLQIKSKELQELHRAKIEIAELKREQETLKLQAQAEAQQGLNEELAREKERLTRMAQEESERLKRDLAQANELQLKAKDEQLAQIKRELDNAQRKAEQGSMQVQGEALELVIESWLESQFPFDTIEEVKKGAFGADCLQRVHTREVAGCGIICYESKNTKNWSSEWISKLKQDMLSVHADIGVIVTAVYPKGMDRMGFVDGIWVCSLEEFKGSASLLRETLIRVEGMRRKEENKTDKMTLLYNYMTGNEFGMQMKAIVEGFIKMQSELNKEKRSLTASWKRRQKMIDGVLQNTTEMYGALQAIAGASAMVEIEALELDDEQKGLPS
jgi:hypothetical protein